ncbi:hypothetical protein AVEN_116481-1, partial [Araneus ventricosus]
SDGLKPDLVFRKGRDIFIIDVACPFENRPSALEDARKEKCDKYASLLPFYSSRGYNPVIIPIIVGALGSWDPKNDSFLSKHMSKSYLHKFRHLCVSETVKWSRDIYVQHITGKKQYEENGQDFEEQQPQGPQTYFEYINSQADKESVVTLVSWPYAIIHVTKSRRLKFATTTLLGKRPPMIP